MTYDDEITNVGEMESALSDGGFNVGDAVDITPNSSPVADAGPELTVTEGDSVILDGSLSSDPDGDDLRHEWAQISGDNVAISDSTSERAGFTAPEVDAAGADLVFELTVTDPSESVSTDRVTIHVADTEVPEHIDVTPAEAKQMVDSDDSIVILDVREEDEYCARHISNAFNYPWESGVFEQSIGNFSKEDVFLVVCKSGYKSNLAAELLDENYFVNVYEMTGGMDEWQWDTAACPVVDDPPTAVAGNDLDVAEGVTIALDGSGSTDDSRIATYGWTQSAGLPVLETAISGPLFSIVAPAVDVSGGALTFTLTVTDDAGQSAVDDIVITVRDNGISGFPEGVIPFVTSTGRNLGIRIESGGLLSSLAATNVNSASAPDDMVYGEIAADIQPGGIGGTASFTIFLPEPAPAGYNWYEYDHDRGWITDSSRSAAFAEDRTQVTLTVTDGGAGDTDGEADGIIRTATGLGNTGSDSGDEDSGGGGGGCFVSSVFER